VLSSCIVCSVTDLGNFTWGREFFRVGCLSPNIKFNGPIQVLSGQNTGDSSAGGAGVLATGFVLPNVEFS
jgi:hypothetical protein